MRANPRFRTRFSSALASRKFRETLVVATVTALIVGSVVAVSFAVPVRPTADHPISTKLVGPIPGSTTNQVASDTSSQSAKRHTRPPRGNSDFERALGSCWDAIKIHAGKAAVKKLLAREFPGITDAVGDIGFANDAVNIVYETQSGELIQVPFDFSKFVYSMLEDVGGKTKNPVLELTGLIGQPATDCLQAALWLTQQAGKKWGSQLRARFYPCPSGQVRDGGGTCQLPACPTGQTREGDGTCRTPACPDDQVRNGDGVCERPACPDGQTRDGDCQLPACPIDQVRNNGGVCELPACPDGQSRGDDNNCQLPACPSGQIRDGDGVCQLPACPAGQVRNSGGVCELPACPDGQSRDGDNNCQLPACPSGQVRGGDGVCQLPACPSGQVRGSDGACQLPACPSGQVRGSDGACQLPACPSRQVRGSDGVCELPPCPPGQTRSGSQCVPFVILGPQDQAPTRAGDSPDG